MGYVYRMYEWRAVGAEEERAIADYFASRHWQQAFALIQDPGIGDGGPP